ncbi:MAG: NAD-dependent malic enzyme, partial [Solirubrobacteraceae bacterium]|nr:NAD-dependent malic enzyme [Solirubrobacteraceae bacterium]
MSRPSAQYSVVLRVEIDDSPGAVTRLVDAIVACEGEVVANDVVSAERGRSVRDVVVNCSSSLHQQTLRDLLDAVEDVRVLGLTDRTFALHHGGKLSSEAAAPLRTRDDLAMAYTPGVARVCEAIHRDKAKAFDYTIKRNTVAVVSDGTAVLGMGDIGPEAAMPVMEGKCVLFKEFAGVDAFPICLDTKDTEEIIRTVKLMAPTFGGINLEDISAPRCFEIEDRLKAELDIPVFHDDQHGTAIVTLAAVYNALKLIDKRIEDLRVLCVGIGAAGVAVTKILMNAGVRDVIGCDRQGALSTTRPDYIDGSMNSMKRWYAENSNPGKVLGSPKDVIDDIDLFIGLSGPGVIEAKDLSRMARDAMVFAMSNPDPEVNPEEAAPYVRILATGRSDYPNQINNVLAFPGIFRGAMDVRARAITEEMKIAAARAIADAVPADQLREDFIIPSVFDREVAPAVAAAVALEADRQ